VILNLGWPVLDDFSRAGLLLPLPSQLAEKLKFLSFRGALRAEESLFSCVETKERFLTSFGMTIQITFSAAYLAAGRTGGAS